MYGCLHSAMKSIGTVLRTLWARLLGKHIIAMITTINRIAIITTINRIAIATTINIIAIATTINRIAIATTKRARHHWTRLDNSCIGVCVCVYVEGTL